MNSFSGALFAAFGFLSALTCQAGVRTGADRLFDPEFRGLVAGKRVGVLAHAASRLAAGTHLVDALRAHGFDVREIFAPEHGFRGRADEPVGDSRDPVTGLPVYSLYGPRKAPTQDQLAQVDVLVIDLQSVGVRFYTYPASMAWTLEACARARVPVVVLDRPDVAASYVEGPLLAQPWWGERTSFYPSPTIAGMTMGELAGLFNDKLRIGAALKVVPAEGWYRAMSWADTGLAWTAPSPALVTPDQALLYVAFGALETLRLAVGRGLDNHDAFRIYGAPWISREDSRELAVELGNLGLPGLAFEPVEWTPDRREFQGRLCRGFRVRLTDARALTPFASLVSVLTVMTRRLGAELGLERIDHALGERWVRDAIESGEEAGSIVERARAEGERFRDARSAHLLYE